LLYAGAFLLFLYQPFAAHYDPAFTFPVAALLIGSIGAKTFQLSRLNSTAQHGEIVQPYPPLPENSAVVSNTAASDMPEPATQPSPLVVMTRDRILVLVLVALLMILKFLAS